MWCHLSGFFFLVTSMMYNSVKKKRKKKKIVDDLLTSTISSVSASKLASARAYDVADDWKQAKRQSFFPLSFGHSERL